MDIYFIKIILIQLLIIYQVSSAEKAKAFQEDIHYCSKIGTTHGKTSSDCNDVPNDIFGNISPENAVLCVNSFEISCLDAHQKVHCEHGIKAAKSKEACDEQSSYSFRKCCNACKFGIEMKLTLATCTKTSLVSHNVIDECCISAPYSVPFNDESQPANTGFSYCENMMSACDDETETCVDIFDGYRCDCKSGYKKNSKNKCVDINECKDKSHNCQSYETCVNEIGSYRCDIFTCPAGLEPKQFDGIDGYECVDIDECLDNPCGIEAVCDNSYGSYECAQRDVLNSSCQAGYRMENGICVDVDECAEQKCDGFCRNLDGGFKCENVDCGPDYTKFLKTYCRRNCNIRSPQCKSRPLRIGHFFKVIDPDAKYREIFSIVVPSSKVYSKYRLQKFSHEFFSFKELGRGASIVMKHVPKDEMEMTVVFDVYDRNEGTFKGTYEFIYHVYVQESKGGSY